MRKFRFICTQNHDTMVSSRYSVIYWRHCYFSICITLHYSISVHWHTLTYSSYFEYDLVYDKFYGTMLNTVVVGRLHNYSNIYRIWTGPVKFRVKAIMKWLVLGCYSAIQTVHWRRSWISNIQIKLVLNYFHPMTEPRWASNWIRCNYRYNPNFGAVYAKPISTSWLQFVQLES